MTAAAHPQSLLVQMLDPAVRADPYPVYDQIRTQGPIQLPGNNLTVFASYAHCDEVLRHPAAASDRLKSTAAQRAIAEGAQPRPFGPPGFLFLDPPDHTRLRRLVSKAFVPKVVKALEPDIVAMVDELLDGADGAWDAVAGLAYPLPVAVICRLLGVPLEDEPQFSAASALLAQGLDPFLTVTGSTDGNFDQRMEAGLWLRGYLRDLISKRRKDPGDDLMSGLIHVEESGDQLTEDEIVATCNLLLIAGHETTATLITSAVERMLHDPALRDLAIERIRELGDLGQENGVQISLEMYEDTYVGTADDAVSFLGDVDHANVGLNPDIGNIVRLHREVEPWQDMFEKVLPHANFWHIKNYSRDFDPATGAYATAPTPLKYGYINYRQVIRRALDLGYTGPFCCEHYGSDSLGVIAENVHYIRQVLTSALADRDAA